MPPLKPPSPAIGRTGRAEIVARHSVDGKIPSYLVPDLSLRGLGEQIERMFNDTEPGSASFDTGQPEQPIEA